MQVGDKVIYVKSLHARYLEQSGSDKNGEKSQELGIILRHFEPCTIERIEYILLDPPTPYTVARLTLVLRDVGESISVDVPPPVANFSEFVVPEYRFDASWQASPTRNGRVKACMLKGEEVGGCWYTGTVLKDSLERVQISRPLETEALLSRYKVRNVAVLPLSLEFFGWSFWLEACLFLPSTPQST